MALHAETTRSAADTHTGTQTPNDTIPSLAKAAKVTVGNRRTETGIPNTSTRYTFNLRLNLAVVNVNVRTAIGCRDPAPPKYGWVIRESDGVWMGCNFSDHLRWRLTCDGVRWIGEYENCSSGKHLCTCASLNKTLKVKGKGSLTIGKGKLTIDKNVGQELIMVSSSGPCVLETMVLVSRTKNSVLVSILDPTTPVAHPRGVQPAMPPPQSGHGIHWSIDSQEN